jgi:hypothetical protein
MVVISSMSDIMNMRRLLGSEGALTSPLSSEERDILLKGHIEDAQRSIAGRLGAD